MSMETMITLLRVTHMQLLSSISPSSSLLKLPLIAIYWATCGTQLWNWPSLSKKRQNGGRLTQKARVSWPTLPPPPTSMGADFYGEGKGHRFGLANRFGARFGTNTKLSQGVIRPISTPNDYLNKVFDDLVSLCGSCRNNALPRSAWEKLQLVAILSLRETRLSLQERNMRIV